MNQPLHTSIAADLGRRRDRRAVLLAVGGVVVLPLAWPHRAGAEEATPAAPAGGEVLLRATFAASELPGEGASCVLYQLTLAPGTTLPVLAGPYCGCEGQTLRAGVGTEVVVTGDYAVRSAGAIRVQRMDGTSIEEVPAGREAVLRAGDVVSHLDLAAGGEFRNAGIGDLVLLGVAIVGRLQLGGTPVPDLPSGARPRELNTALPSDWRKLPPGPLTIELRRMTVAPSATVALSPFPGLVAAAIEAGEIAWGADSEAPTRYGPGGRTPFAAYAAGTRLRIENIRAEPATVLVLAAMASPADATPTT